MTIEVNYEAPPTITRFLSSSARRRLVCGPFGSGKSTGCCVELVRRAKEQKPATGGVIKGKRATRWAIVRNTVPQLRDTTIKTWLSWFPDGSCGYWREVVKTFYVEFGDVRAEMCFRALDDANDVKNLLSLEITGAYLNECREIPREIVEALDGRIGRYPRMVDGGPSWVGMIADTNAPEEGSYWHAIMEGLDPDNITQRKASGWEVFNQPPGMLQGEPDPRAPGGRRLVPNPAAENVRWLPPGYYENLCQNNTWEFIKVYVLGKYGTSKAGKPVHPLFSEDIHVAADTLVPNPRLDLIIAADFGLTPAIVLKQQDTFGRVLTLDEIVTENMGLQRCIDERLWPLLRRKYEGFNYIVTGDPAGNTRAQTDERSCVTIFKNARFRRVKMARSNTPVDRTGATDYFLGRRVDIGPMYLIDPGCSYLKAGMKGGYHYKVNRTTKVVSDSPEKNIYSHVCEAGQYGDMYFHVGVTKSENANEANRMAAESRARRGVYTRRAS